MTEETKTVEQTTTPSQNEETKSDTTVSQDPNTESSESSQVTLSKEEHEALLKSKEVGDTYKAENEKFREREKAERLKEFSPQQETQAQAEPAQQYVDDDQVQKIQDDYSLRRKSVLSQRENDINSLPEDQWQKIKPMLQGSLDGVYSNAVRDNRYVGESELNSIIDNLITYAKGPETSVDAESARLAGQADMIAANAAGSVGAPSGAVTQGDSVGVTDEDRQTAEATGGMVSPERLAEIRKNKAEREREYQPRL